MMDQKRIPPIEDSKKTVSAMVQDSVRSAILNGILPSGSRLDQKMLAVDLGVSLVPIREALKKLEGEGFVQIIPRRGAFVTETSLRDMEDLYFTRAIVEGQAAYHAAERLTDANLTHLDALMEQMQRALGYQEYDHFMTYNRQFHFEIYNAAGHRYLSNVITNLWELAERYRYRYVFLKDQGASIQKEHQTILDACHARDSKRLRDGIIHHMNQTLTGIREYIEHENQSGN